MKCDRKKIVPIAEPVAGYVLELTVPESQGLNNEVNSLLNSAGLTVDSVPVLRSVIDSMRTAFGNAIRTGDAA